VSGYRDVFDTDERRALRSLVRDFTEREVVPYLEDWEQSGDVPRELHKRAAAAGILGIAFPEDVGGGGGSVIDAAIVTEAIIGSGGSSGLCAALFTHGIAVPHIARSGDAALIDRFVRPTLAGETIGAVGVSGAPGGNLDEDCARFALDKVKDRMK